MQITRGYRTELDLNNHQITACKKHAGAARWAWNWGLARKQAVYQESKCWIGAMELHRELNELKQTEIPWMYEVSKAAPQEALRDLDQAFRNFFRRVRLKKEGKWKGKLGFPKCKTKRRGLGSFRVTGAIHVYEKAIELPRLGRLRLKECGYLPTSGVHILSATVSEEAGRWYVAVQVEEEVASPPPATGFPLGVDLGSKTLAQCSDGRVIANPKALRSELRRLKRLHRRLSRKQKGSKNRAKARGILARKVKQKHIQQLLRQARTVDAPLRPSVIILEDLNVDGMRRNRKLALSISDVGFGEFKRQMTYKALWQGGTLLLADRWFPSTKVCSGCSHIKAEIDLSERVYVCDNCHLVIDRDLNAALNLAALAHEVRSLAKQNPDRGLEVLFQEVMAKTMQAYQPDPYREFLGKGETPVEKEALADLS